MADTDPVDEPAEHAEEAAKLFNGLETVGPTGSRLAVSEGSEKVLAFQLATHLGLAPRKWHVQYLEGLVRSAKQMEDLEGRLGGSAMSPSQQRIADAMNFQEKEGQ